ncbi:MAG: hypothetical protein ISN26_04920 [Betaproteobacteria bacterium AqS2]|uniref:Uncharacterized protein n=1 Tax=Candidatus Amphirhobacter heronislandensis TaxID=1732024 RepID=A0A930UF24_9GAMM|nr:hypothetical protein [Betaproteobacteria bacterium AqS2]
MPGYEKVSKKSRVCATCDHWRSYDRRPINENLEIEYEVYQKAECGGTINREQMMTPLSKCKDWRMWTKLVVKPITVKDAKTEMRNLNRIRKAKEYLGQQAAQSGATAAEGAAPAAEAPAQEPQQG